MHHHVETYVGILIIRISNSVNLIVQLVLEVSGTLILLTLYVTCYKLKKLTYRIPIDLLKVIKDEEYQTCY